MNARRLLVPSFPCLLWILILAAIAILFAPRMVGGDGDLALHLQIGRTMIEERSLVETEPTCFRGDGVLYIDHEWGAQVVFAAAEKAFGLAGPLLLAGLLVATTFALMMTWLRRTGVDPWPAVLVAAFAFTVARIHLAARPHVFSWLLGLVWLIRLDLVTRGRIGVWRWLAVAVPMIVVWTNLHAGFLLAFFLLGLHGLALLARLAVAAPNERAEPAALFSKLFAAGLVLLAASLLNPWTWHLHAHFLAYIGNEYMTAFTAEWASPDFHGAGARFLPFLLATLASVMIGRRRPEAIEWILVIALAWAALRSNRNIALFALLAGPVLARRLQVLIEEASRTPSVAGALASRLRASSGRLARAEAGFGGWLTAGLVAVALAFLIRPGGPVPVEYEPGLQPVRAVEWIRTHPEALEGRGRMFNAYDWGGFLGSQLAPGHRTFVNGFNDHLGEAVLRDYDAVRFLEHDWEAILARHDVGWTVLKTGSELVAHLDLHPAWRRAYTDELTTIHIRVDDE